jgi:hypothetical protein
VCSLTVWLCAGTCTVHHLPAWPTCIWACLPAATLDFLPLWVAMRMTTLNLFCQDACSWVYMRLTSCQRLTFCLLLPRPTCLPYLSTQLQPGLMRFLSWAWRNSHLFPFD